MEKNRKTERKEERDDNHQCKTEERTGEKKNDDWEKRKKEMRKMEYGKRGGKKKNL